MLNSEQVGVLPPWARVFEGQIERESGGSKYVFELLRRNNVNVDHAATVLRVFKISAGQSCLLPMRLQWASLLYKAIMTWPPANLDEVFLDRAYDDEKLVIRFHEPFTMDAIHQPPSFLTESMWDAVYSERGQSWRLERVRHLTEADWGDLRPLLE